ncbi:AMP-binding protein [Vandammella animalimorsus]|nr:AMP-binding protein [Vandammella animalimorsus]
MSTPAPATIYDALQDVAQRMPERPALTFVRDGSAQEQARVVSYRELLAGITRAANLFVQCGGVGVGVAYLLPSVVETHFVLWGAETAGYAVPLNPFLTEAQIEELVRGSGARILVTVGSLAPDVWQKSLHVQRRIPGLQLLCLGPAGPLDEAAEGAAIQDLGAALAQQPSEQLQFSPVADARQPIAYFHTGGTTGLPKLVAHTHANQLSAARGGAELLDVRPQDCITNGMPLFHVGGSIACSLAFFLRGANVLMLSPLGFRNPAMVQNIWRMVERYQVTVLGAVPTALASVLAVPVDARIDSLRCGLTGAALCPAAVSQRFAQVTGKPIYELLGMTETGGVTASDDARVPPTAGSVGRAIAGSQIRVRQRLADGRLGADCAPGEVGVLFVTGPNVSPGYRDPEQNAGVFEEGGLNTGDLAYLDAQGRLFIAGRSKDLIIRSGHNIDPAMIEQAFTSHPAVEAAAAVGQPDRYAGELPVVFLVLREPQTDLAALQAYAQQHIAERPAWPKALYVLDALPVTAVGKPYKPALRAEAAVRLLEPALRQLSGDAQLQVQASEGGKRGLDVRVRLSQPSPQAQQAIREELDGYAFAWTLDEGWAGLA